MKILASLLLALIPLRLPFPDQFRKAGEIIDRIYLRQAAGPCVKLLPSMSKTEREKFMLNFGPFSRTQGKFFVKSCQCLPGCGNYPEDLDLQELKEAMKKDETGQLRVYAYSPLTVVIRSPEGYEAVPYSKFFGKELEELSSALKSIRTGDETLDAYLKKRAEEVLIDRFEEGDGLWLKIKGNLRAYFGPVQVEDPYLGVKMAYGGLIFRVLPGELLHAPEKLLLKIQKMLPGRDIRGLHPLPYPGIFKAELLGAYGVYKAPPVPSFAVLPPFLPDRAAKFLFVNVIREKYRRGISVASRWIEEWKGKFSSYLLFLSLHDLAHFLNIGEKTGGWMAREIFADATAMKMAFLLEREGKLPEGEIEDLFITHILFYSMMGKKPALAELNFLLSRGGVKITEGGKIEKMLSFRNAVNSMWKFSLNSIRTGSRFPASVNLPQALGEVFTGVDKIDFYLETNTINENLTGGSK